MRFVLTILTVFSASLAMAETTHFEISGMTCKNCVKHVQTAVCDQLKEVAEKCDVKIGSVAITPKAGQTIDPKKVDELLAKTHYKVTKSEAKK